MHSHQSAQVGMTADLDMTGQRRYIGHDDVVVEDAVMGHVAIGHQHAVVANDCAASSTHGSPVNGDVLPDSVTVADEQLGCFALIVHVLRRRAYRGEGADVVALADTGGATDHRMGINHGVRADDLRSGQSRHTRRRTRLGAAPPWGQPRR